MHANGGVYQLLIESHTVGGPEMGEHFCVVESVGTSVCVYAYVCVCLCVRVRLHPVS